MNAIKFATPLMLALALVGCNKKTETASNDPAPAASTTTTTTTTTTQQPTTITAQSGTATATATVGSATATATDPNVANMTADQHKDAREDIMKSWGKANKAMNAMVKDPTKFDAQVIKTNAAKMAQDNPWVHFPESAKGGESKDAVWTDAAGFQQEIDRYKTAISALNTAAQSATNIDGVKTQIGDVGASCKSCHEKFKED